MNPPLPAPPLGFIPPLDFPAEQQLFYAVRNRDIDRVAILLKNPSVNVNWQNPDLHFATPLHSSCFFQVYPAFQLLLADPRTNVNLRNIYGNTPLSIAAFTDGLQMVKDLLADPRTDVNVINDRGESSLWRAVHSGNLEVIKWLLASKEKVETATVSTHQSVVPETTPAQLARFKNFPDLARVIDEYEVNHEKIRFQLRILLGEPAESAAAIFALVVFQSDNYLQVTSLRKYRELKAQQRLAEASMAPPEPKDPNKVYYPKMRQPAPTATEDRKMKEKEKEKEPEPEESKQMSEAERAELEERKSKEQEVLDRRKYSEMVRFFRISQRLPLELQMVLCNRACFLNKTIIRSSVSEHAFRNLVLLYNESS